MKTTVRHHSEILESTTTVKVKRTEGDTVLVKAERGGTLTLLCGC